MKIVNFRVMYPQTRLTRPIRRGLMTLLIILYLVIAPVIIAYTVGYRYDFKTGLLKETGVLSVDVKPKNALVYINDTLLKQGLPIYLPNRAPGSYKIKISLPGYKDWEKDTLIESKKTFYIKNITLFKESLPVEIMKDYNKSITDIHFSSNATFSLITSEKDKIYEINLVNLNNFTTQTMLRAKSDAKPKISWSPFNDFALIQTYANGAESLQIFSVDNIAQNKTYNFPEKISDIQWDKNAAMPTVFLKTNDQIASISAQERKNLIETKSEVWHVNSENEIWLKTGEKEITAVDANGQEIKKLFLRDGAQKIIDINQNRAITSDGQNINVTTLDGEKTQDTVTTPTQNVFFNQKTKEWILWSPWELWSAYENGKTALLNRTSEKIRFMLPLDDYGVLLLASENKITGFNPGYYVTHELLNGVRIYQISADTEQRKIFFFGDIDGKKGLFELDY